ncbi:methyltransferase domain-containing protein [Aquibacillus koreensis]|uniref:Methyltransferase domain-containing protein n=1 Tax=Aquibacillus koreensis TaxID=279446 RepID=A0A9X3WJG1_9BACI|nr:class I SAM-dependent methyltransferase [Aquibacillus koreensis]MCT2538169.1 methyltransferase domain-containing protein [Aquibacillus koreensis]MDC3420887.1 methyltransferase domain-containing protein [Aquibacillus koreensis]
MTYKWNAKLYDGKHSFVSEYGNELVEMLGAKPGEEILDIGSGTGDLANEISEHRANVVGIDQSADMVKQAVEKYPHLQFFVKDILDLDDMEEYDAIFSNATLHWVKQPEQALRRMYTTLKTGGRFVAEFGGKGNIEAISNEIIRESEKMGMDYNEQLFPWYFPSIAEYTTLMERVGFHVVFAQHIDRPTPLEGEDGLRNWIQMFAGGMFANQPSEQKARIISEVEKNLREVLYQNGTWYADYKRIRVVGLK